MFTERDLEKKFKRQLQENLSVVHGIVSQDLLEIYMKAYKKRALPLKEQQRKAQLPGTVAGSFSIQIGDSMHEVHNVIPLVIGLIILQVPAMSHVWPLDLAEADVPDGDQEMFKFVSGARKSKIEAEMESKEQQTVLLHLKLTLTDYDAAANVAQAALQQTDDSAVMMQQLIEDLNWNSHLVLCLKQGSIEVPLFADQMFDLNDAVVVQRKAVVDINRLIVSAGTENLGIMKATIGSSRDLYKLRWQESVADWKIDAVMEDTRYFQLLRVTKELQQLIKNGGKNKHQQEISTLERQIEHVKALHELRIDERKRKLFRSHRLIKEKELENDRLNE